LLVTLFAKEKRRQTIRQSVRSHKGALCDIAPGYGPAWAVGRSVALGLSLREVKIQEPLLLFLINWYAVPPIFQNDNITTIKIRNWPD
jgi:hypothetical protein